MKKYPVIGACGLDCGLCPRYHTAGESRCPGCCGPDFFNKHPSCGFITCCVRQKNLETCAQCGEWRECERVAKIIDSPVDSFLSYRPLADNYALVQRNGIEELARIETEKLEILCHLLDNYNDGRAKSFYCTACQLLPVADLRVTVREAERDIPPDARIKDKARVMRGAISKLADKLKINLKLRK